MNYLNNIKTIVFKTIFLLTINLYIYKDIYKEIKLSHYREVRRLSVLCWNGLPVCIVD